MCFFFLDCFAGKVQGTTYYYKASLCIWQLWAKGVWVSFIWAKCLQTPSQREDSWSITGRNQTQVTPSLFVFDTSAWILYLVMQVSAGVQKFSHYLWKMFSVDATLLFNDLFVWHWCILGCTNAETSQRAKGDGCRGTQGKAHACRLFLKLFQDFPMNQLVAAPQLFWIPFHVTIVCAFDCWNYHGRKSWGQEGFHSLKKRQWRCWEWPGTETLVKCTWRSMQSYWPRMVNHLHLTLWSLLMNDFVNIGCFLLPTLLSDSFICKPYWRFWLL